MFFQIFVVQHDNAAMHTGSISRHGDDEKESIYNTPNTPAPMKTFYSRQATPTAPSASPYATTTLVGGGKDSAFRPIIQDRGYNHGVAPVHGSGSSGADSSCVMRGADGSSVSDHSEPGRQFNGKLKML